MTKRIRSKRIGVYLPDQAEAAYYSLKESNPDATDTQIVGDALRLAHRFKLYDNMFNFDKSGLPIKAGMEKALKVTTEDIANLKKHFCAKYGGSCDSNGYCAYTKYEMTLSGQAVKTARTDHIDDLPADEETFRHLVLGRFTTLEKAKVAAQPIRPKEQNNDQK